MLHALPITNVRLSPCHEDWQQMTPAPGGRHCASCDRVVVDFTRATTAELAAAQATAPDGRVCGKFQRPQLAGGRPVRFGLRTRAFVLALALVLLQGLTAQDAWAQARQKVPTKAKTAARRPVGPSTSQPKPVPPAKAPVTEPEYICIYPIEETPEPTSPPHPTDSAALVYTYVEQMPQPPGGLEGLKQYLAQNLHYSNAARQQQVEGKVFVQFVVGRDGQLTDLQVTKGLGAGCDEEALRVVGRMPAWTPGRQQGRLVSVRYTLPVVFTLPAAQ
jgi:TonB family protein